MWEKLHRAATSRRWSHRAWENLWEDTMSAAQQTRSREVLTTLAPENCQVYILTQHTNMHLMIFTNLKKKKNQGLVNQIPRTTIYFFHYHCDCLRNKIPRVSRQMTCLMKKKKKNCLLLWFVSPGESEGSFGKAYSQRSLSWELWILDSLCLEISIAWEDNNNNNKSNLKGSWSAGMMHGFWVQSYVCFAL